MALSTFKYNCLTPLHFKELINLLCYAEKVKEGSMAYLLSDIDDQSIYMTGQFFRDSAINPCIESSYRFVEHVMQQVVDMHKVRLLCLCY